MFEDAAKKIAKDTKEDLTKVSEKTDATTKVITFVYTRKLDTTDTDDDAVLKCGEDWAGLW